MAKRKEKIKDYSIDLERTTKHWRDRILEISDDPDTRGDRATLLAREIARIELEVQISEEKIAKARDEAIRILDAE